MPPIPNISPIIVSALPILNSLNANTLLKLLKKIMDGLHAQGISVVSYACDGTEVERGVQRKFLKELTERQEYQITNP